MYAPLLLTAVLSAVTPTPPEDLGAEDLRVEAVARDFRIVIYETHRADRAEYDALRQSGDEMLKAWYDAGTPGSHRDEVAAWFEEARRIVLDGNNAPLPEMPTLPEPPEPLHSETLLQRFGIEAGPAEFEPAGSKSKSTKETAPLPALAPPMKSEKPAEGENPFGKPKKEAGSAADAGDQAGSKEEDRNSGLMSSLRAVVGRLFAFLG